MTGDITALPLTKHLRVPTGDIAVCQGDSGLLELVSVADYGKEKNLKADFLGLTNEPQPFQHAPLLPLEDKWVVTISTQYGCHMMCAFCDVPKVGTGVNVSFADLAGQILTGIKLHPEVKNTNRLNVHFARMGEPTLNRGVLECARWLKEASLPVQADCVHPVVSTMMPKNNMLLKKFITEWMEIKNSLFEGEAGLQISINSTNRREREEMFQGNALDLESISNVMRGFYPKGRKITLNFALAGYEIDPDALLKWFDPRHYLVKLTPMHRTETAEEHGIRTTDGYRDYYPYREHERALSSAGYDVIVFLASEYEDLGRITCGNAILAGTKPEVPYEEIL